MWAAPPLRSSPLSSNTLSYCGPADPLAPAGTLLALAVLWCREDPGRVGDVALLPARGAAVLGRQPATPFAPIPVLGWLRQRPDRNEPRPALTSAYISRDQLRFDGQSGGRLRVTNVGRCPLHHNGRPVDSAEVAPGDLLELAGQASFLVVRRPRMLPACESDAPAFGQADADGIVGESPAAWALRGQIRFVSARDVHVLVLGASGTGKELVARAIHAHSRRSGQTLVSRNAATFPETLIDAELFGNARGYPNPGMPERGGLVGEANGSTLFLDEFSELPHALQAHLLRVLDAGEYSRLGESRARRSDFRLIAASNRPEADLKHDLRARLPLTVRLPDLNERPEDIPLLALHIVRRIAAADRAAVARFLDGPNPRMSPALIGWLVRRRWTTHVRELEAILWRSIQESPGGELERPEEAPDVAEVPPASVVNPESLTPEVIQAALDAHGGRQEPTWRALGLASRHVLGRLVQRHGLRVRGRR